MNVKAARRQARNLMIRHGLAAWRLDFMNHHCIAAQTSFTDHSISLTVEFVQAYTPDQLTQLVLHEIAHALRGPSDLSGHDSKWLKTARSLGYLHGDTMPAHYPTPNIRWNLTCPATGDTLQTPEEPDEEPFCKLCNDLDCVPKVQRRQIVTADVHRLPAPDHIFPIVQRLRSLFTSTA